MSEHALEAYPDADITVLTVVGKPSPMWGEATGLALADDLEEAAQEHAHAVFDRADDYETVVVGSHGGSVSEYLYVGNVAKKVVNRSSVPVVVVR
ncbi:universal stress protein [Natrialba taiwanensis]